MPPNTSSVNKPSTPNHSPIPSNNPLKPSTVRPEKRGRGRPPIHKKDDQGRPIIELNPDGSRVVPVQKYEKKVRTGGSQSTKPAPILAAGTPSASASGSGTATMRKRKAKEEPRGTQLPPKKKRKRKIVWQDEDEEEEQELELEDDDEDEAAFSEPPQAEDSEWEEEQKDEEDEEKVKACLTGPASEKGKGKANEEAGDVKPPDDPTREIEYEGLGLYIHPGLLWETTPEGRVLERETRESVDQRTSAYLPRMASLVTEHNFTSLPPVERWIMALEEAGIICQPVAEDSELLESSEIKDLMVYFGMEERTEVYM